MMRLSVLRACALLVLCAIGKCTGRSVAMDCSITDAYVDIDSVSGICKPIQHKIEFSREHRVLLLFATQVRRRFHKQCGQESWSLSELLF
jgi:hypothetical protein